MDLTKLSFEQLHGKLRTIKDHSKKPYQKHPEEVAQLVNEALRRGMSLQQIQSLSQIAGATLRSMKKKSLDPAAKRSSQVAKARPDFVAIKVDGAERAPSHASSSSRARITIDGKGLTIELGIEELTSDLLRSLRALT
jgi:uncharacterized protein YpuA (DUF1002 family)